METKEWIDSLFNPENNRTDKDVLTNGALTSTSQVVSSFLLQEKRSKAINNIGVKLLNILVQI